MGIKQKEIIERSLLLYLESVKKILDVEKEFDAWDTLSDESFRGLSKRLQSRL